MLRHPRYRTLNRFADGELGARKRRQVADHLTGCDRCRKEVSFIRQAGDLARALEPPPLPDDLLGRVLERRAADERVILPLEPPGAARPAYRRAAPAVAAGIALVALGLFVSTGLLEADRPGLRIRPEHPVAGDTLTVEYDGGHEFSDLDRLVLRTRFATGAARSWQQVGGILERGNDGFFRTTLPLPDSVVYAAFAVENLQGDRVDHNAGRLWDVMVYGPDGRPTLDALTQRYLDVLSRNRPEAQRTVASLTTLYPGSARGWWLAAFHANLGSGSDSAAAFYRDKLRELEQAYAQAPPADPDAFAFLALFAGTMGELADLQHWATEAERRGARSRWLAQAKTMAVLTYRRLPAAEAERELEAIWRESPTPVASIATNGWLQALQAEDWDAAIRWLTRIRAAQGFDTPADFLTGLRDTFGPRAALSWALDHAEDELLRTEASRLLTQAPREQQRVLDAERQKLLATMASMAADIGRLDVAQELALDGLTVAWETDALATLGRVLLAVGDTAGAATAFARVAADPGGAPVPEIVTRRADWTERLETARFGLTRHVLDGAVVQYLPGDLAPDTGPAVVAFLSTCGRAAQVVRDLPTERVTVYATSAVDSVRSALEACGIRAPVRADPDGRIAELFGLRAFQALFVTDAVGRIRFSHSAAEDIPRELLALRGEEPDRAD